MNLLLAASLLALLAPAVQTSAPTGAAPPPAAACHPRLATPAADLRIFRDCEGAPEMIALRGGRYRMGDIVGDGQPYERPVHAVQLAPFALGRYEVTNAEWQQCVAAGACTAPQAAVDERHGRYPVAGVSWTQAASYTGWLAARSGKPYRLPSEAEWEYAARAGSEARYPWGSFEPDACSYVNLLDASGRRAHPEWYWAERCDDRYAAAAPVGSFPPNAWGFHDLLGNVWEWVADCWHADYSGAPADGSAWLGEPCRKRVNRGGGWGNNLRALRVSSRDADPAGAASDGLGFRVARSLSPAELPLGPGGTPDGRPPPVEAAAPPLRRGQKPPPAPPPPLPPPPPQFATSLALERVLEAHITVAGRQSWHNGLQHTDGSTAQDFVLATRLRSDGVLYGDNLLDPDLDTRLAVKRQYLARRGLIRLKALGGGRLPHTAEELSALEAQVQARITQCQPDADCGDETAERMAALDALRDNSAADLEALIAAPATGEAARWLYFFGYGGCPNRIHITSETHIAGERAYNHARTHLVPWSLDRSADTPGSPADQAGLCRHYTATVDVRSGTVYLENFYIPSPPGTTHRVRHRHVEDLQEELTVPSELLAWTTAKLLQTGETLEAADTLPANAPLDQDYTPLGTFSGELKVTLSWSFKPAPGAALAQPPAAAPAQSGTMSQ
jgi:formylglycine-generating enzyme required for sulfatase activity